MGTPQMTAEDVKKSGFYDITLSSLVGPDIDFKTALEYIRKLGVAENDPCTLYGLTEQSFQQKLMEFQDDKEIMILAEKVLPNISQNKPLGEEEEFSLVNRGFKNY